MKIKYLIVALSCYSVSSCGTDEGYMRSQFSKYSNEKLIWIHNAQKGAIGLPHERMHARLVNEEIKKRGIVGSGSTLSRISKNQNDF